MVFNRGHSFPQGTFGMVWKHFWLARLWEPVLLTSCGVETTESADHPKTHRTSPTRPPLLHSAPPPPHPPGPAKELSGPEGQQTAGLRLLLQVNTRWMDDLASLPLGTEAHLRKHSTDVSSHSYHLACHDLNCQSNVLQIMWQAEKLGW